MPYEAFIRAYYALKTFMTPSMGGGASNRMQQQPVNYRWATEKKTKGAPVGSLLLLLVSTVSHNVVEFRARASRRASLALPRKEDAATVREGLRERRQASGGASEARNARSMLTTTCAASKKDALACGDWVGRGSLVGPASWVPCAGGQN